MGRWFVLGCALLSLAFSGCAASSSSGTPLGTVPATAQDPTSMWSVRFANGSCLCWAVPPAASGAIPGGTVHTVDVHRGSPNDTTLLRLTMHEEPRGRAEFFVAPPSCKAEEVSDCRSEDGFNDDFTVYEVASPEAGTWRWVVYGSGPGVAQVTYSFRVELRLSPTLDA